MHRHATPAIATIALAGLTSVATAQNIATVTLTTSATTILPGQAVTIGVVITDNIDGPSVFGFDLEISGVGSLPFTTTAPTPNASIFGFNGASTATGAVGLGGSSDILGPDLDPGLDGITVFTFQFTPSGSATIGDFITFTASDGPGPNSALQWGEEGGIVILPREYDEIIFTDLSFHIIPTPPGAALLGLGGLVAARRRR
ncbi:MAG: hypothetical protein ACIARR_00360 [Phycisphaerales bacterium JB059]